MSAATATGTTGVRDLIASFPAAGAGGSTLGNLEKLAARRGMAYTALPNPPSTQALTSGGWQEACTEQLRRAAGRSGADRVVLVGHCMGGLSALRLHDGLTERLALSVALLVINAPCPDPEGRIPTMSHYSDAQVAAALAHDGFPQDLLEDEDMLAEIADGIRRDAVVADHLAEWVAAAGPLGTLHVLSTRGDVFIPPENVVGWRHRVAGEFHLTVADGGHSLDETVIGVLERSLEACLAAVAEPPPVRPHAAPTTPEAE
jgi:surfactin synthase thioesterase subunit